MSDRISVRRLNVATHVGVTDAERTRLQNVLIDLELQVDLVPAGRSDDLNDTVDYDRLVRDVAELVRGSNVKLLETLAHSIAQRACAFNGVQRVTVEVAKEAPPVAEEVGTIAVRITRP